MKQRWTINIYVLENQNGIISCFLVPLGKMSSMPDTKHHGLLFFCCFSFSLPLFPLLSVHLSEVESLRVQPVGLESLSAELSSSQSSPAWTWKVDVHLGASFSFWAIEVFQSPFLAQLLLRHVTAISSCFIFFLGTKELLVILPFVLNSDLFWVCLA